MSNSALPEGIKVFERGWLSANNIFFWSNDDVSIVDTGYVAHQAQTLALIRNQLKAEGLSKLDKIVNTHLHSDHCGGNADRKSTRLNSSHSQQSRMPSSA